MKHVAVAIEGVLAREPIDDFAAAPVIQDGLWLVEFLAGAQPVLVTGSSNEEGVRHFLRSNGIRLAVEFPRPRANRLALWTNRLDVLTQMNYQYRGNLVVVDTSYQVCQTMLAQGAMLLRPTFPTRRGEVDANDYVPLRPVTRFWGHT